MKTNIVLTGFMGTGKSITGKIIARKLHFEYIDTDLMIEDASGFAINEIFKNYGETHFRDLENRIIDTVSQTAKPSVIATGGGAVLRQDNIEHLRSGGILFNLSASIDVILKHLSLDDDTRPVVSGKDRAQIEEILKNRRPFYDNCDYKIVIDGKSAEDVADEIIMIYHEARNEQT